MSKKESNVMPPNAIKPPAPMLQKNSCKHCKKNKYIVTSKAIKYPYIWGNEFNEKEWSLYKNFKPSIFQRIFWIVWPTMTYMKWKKYKDISIEEIKV